MTPRGGGGGGSSSGGGGSSGGCESRPGKVRAGGGSGSGSGSGQAVPAMGHALGAPLQATLQDLPDILLWKILQYVSVFNHLPRVLHDIKPFRKVVSANVNTDADLLKWFGEEIPFVKTFCLGSGLLDAVHTVPLIAVGGLWAALRRVCGKCDVCGEDALGTIDEGLWLLTHYKCLYAHLVSMDTVTAVGVETFLTSVQAPRTIQRQYIHGNSGWIPPGFRRAWTLIGAVLAQNSPLKDRCRIEEGAHIHAELCRAELESARAFRADMKVRALAREEWERATIAGRMARRKERMDALLKGVIVEETTCPSKVVLLR